jgi:hypothetical protein
MECSLLLLLLPPLPPPRFKFKFNETKTKNCSVSTRESENVGHLKGHTGTEKRNFLLPPVMSIKKNLMQEQIE